MKEWHLKWKPSWYQFTGESGADNVELWELQWMWVSREVSSWVFMVSCSQMFVRKIETKQSQCICCTVLMAGTTSQVFSDVFFFFFFCLYLCNFWHSAVGFVTCLCSTRGTERHHTKVLMMSWWSLLRLPVSGVAESVLLCLSHCRMLINCEVEQPPNTHPVLFCLMGAPQFFFFFPDVQRSRS